MASGGATIVTGSEGYAAASSDGNAAVFLGSGAMGDAVSSVLGPLTPAPRLRPGVSVLSRAQVGVIQRGGYSPQHSTRWPTSVTRKPPSSR